MGRPRKAWTDDAVATSVRIPSGLHQKLKMTAIARGVSVNEVILSALEAHLQVSEITDMVKEWKKAGGGHVFDVLSKEHAKQPAARK
jgi:hypothetical protein